MAMKYKGLIVTPLAEENCYLVKREDKNESWEIRVIYHYITGYTVDTEIVGCVDIELVNPHFNNNGKLKNNPPVNPLKQMFMALARYDMCVAENG